MKKKIILYLKKYRWSLIIPVIVGLIVHFQLYSNMLKNWDSWQYQTCIAGTWELSLGRWADKFLDIVQFGTIFPFLGVLICLVIYAVANTILMELFHINNSVVQILMSSLVVASPFTAYALSFYYANDIYAWGYLLAIGAIYCIRETKVSWRRYIASIAMLVVSLGLYQSFIGIAVVVALFLMLTRIIENQYEKIAEMLFEFVKLIGSILSSCVIYMIILQIILKLNQVQLSTYKGASGISIVNMVRELPTTCILTYKYFANYFLRGNESSISRNAYGAVFLHSCFFMIMGVVLFISFFKIKKIYNKIAFLILLALIPVASNLITIMAPGAGIYLMTIGGMLVVIPISFSIMEEKVWKRYKKISIPLLVVICLMSYSYVLQDNTDSMALLQEYNFTDAIMNQVMVSIEAEEDYTPDTEILIAGQPDMNENFNKVTDYYDYANQYATWPLIKEGTSMSLSSWQATARNTMGINLNMCQSDKFESMLQNQEFQDMPLYPAQGSVKKIDGIIVVKIGDVSTW